MYTKKEKKMTLVEQATERLREALLSGRFPKGQNLTERVAGEYLGMSRTPVRSALHTLANEGLLVYQAQRGYQVREFSPKSILDAYQVRAVLEGQACREVAQKGLPKKAAETLSACIDHGRTLLACNESQFLHEEWREMNNRFHHAILEAADNETLMDMLLHVERLPMVSFQTIAKIGAQPDMSLLIGAQLDHERILTSLLEGDEGRASARMTEHVRIAGDLIVRDFDALVPEEQVSRMLAQITKSET